MPSWRQRESEKQTRTRAENESTARARAAVFGEADGRAFRCECGAMDCSRAISVTLAEYESVRAHATRFVVAPNHENPESEQVIDENDRFAVVEEVTNAEVRHARKSDPRAGVNGRARMEALEAEARGAGGEPGHPGETGAGRH